jgi:hypothetical protein
MDTISFAESEGTRPTRNIRIYGRIILNCTAARIRLTIREILAASKGFCPTAMIGPEDILQHCFPLSITVK